MNASHFVVIAGLSLSQAGGAEKEAWSLKAMGAPWRISGEMLDPLNVSGMASVSHNRFVLVCDELKHGVQTGLLDADHETWVLDPKEVSLFKGGKKELDLEDVTTDPDRHCYYACGSCSVSRKTGEAAPNRQWLFRIGTDPSNGTIVPDQVTKVSLSKAMASDPFLAKHLGKSSDQQGIDVEGIAFRDGRLWFGLRSPNVDGRAIVVAASADDLMAERPVAFERFELPVGVDRGIRSIVRVQEGFLLLCGPTGAEGTSKLSFAIWFWTGTAGAPVKVGELDQLPAASGDKGDRAKPEGLFVLSENREQIQVLVASDDAENGAPVRFVLGKPVP